jgi:uncharacterized repeat protein (TIGR01451 family)
MLEKSVSRTMMILILLSSVTVYADIPTAPHNADAMWIEPSIIQLSQYNLAHQIGYRFNVTVSVNLTLACGAWQFRMIYNKAQLKATRCGYTAGDRSQFFENISTIPVSPSYAAFNSTHDRVDFGESWAGVGPFRSPGYGTLAWLEFEVLLQPQGDALESILDISTSAQWPNPKTVVYVGDPSNYTKIIVPTYDCVYQFLPDVMPPAIGILSPQNLTYTASSVPLTFTLNESSSWIGYELDDQENVTITGNTTLSGFSNGQHSLRVFANDTFGNSGVSNRVDFAANVGVDLSIVSPDIGFSDENPTEDETVTISANIQNVGGQSVENVTVHFFDGNNSIGQQQISSISYNSHVEVSVDWTATGEGYHLIKVTVDPYDMIAETDEYNNNATRSLLVGEIPSYGAIILTGEANPNVTCTGATINVFGSAVYNTTYGAGEAVAGADITITITGISQDTTHTISDGSYAKTITAPYVPGNYTIVVTISDHTFSTSVEIPLATLQQEGIDLTVASRDISFVPPDPVEPESVNITANIHNVGTQEAQNVLVIFYSDNNPIGNSTLATIAGGDSEDVSVAWNATPSGWHQIKVTVDPENTTEELNENNNVAFADFYVYPSAPDLTPTSIWFSDSTPHANQWISINTQIRNIGGIGAGNILVSFYDNDQPIGNKTISWIPGKGGAATTYIDYQFTTGGWHKICVVVDPENATNEAEEGNNAYCVYIFVHDPLPDLTLSSGDITFSNSTPAIGDTITVFATIHNIGEQDAQNVTVEFLDGGTKIGETMNIPYLPSGGQVALNVSWNASTEGWHTIRVAIDGNDSIHESNENNNVASRYIYIAPLKAADLCIYSEDIVFSDTAPISGENVTVYATVHNTGEATAEGVVVTFYVDAVQLGSPKTVSSIPVGGNSTVTACWIAFGLGDHTVKVVVDVALESNKNNNNATRGIIVGKHDVAVSNLEIGKNAVGLNYTMNITIHIQNNGYYPETFQIRVYAGPTVIETINITAMGAFNSTIITYVWNTTGFAYGNYTIWAEADIIPSETYTSDNIFIDGEVRVTIPGDVDPVDGYVGIDDIFAIALRFGTEMDGPPNPSGYYYSPVHDITNDGYIGIDDIYIAASHFGQEE